MQRNKEINTEIGVSLLIKWNRVFKRVRRRLKEYMRVTHITSGWILSFILFSYTINGRLYFLELLYTLHILEGRAVVKALYLSLNWLNGNKTAWNGAAISCI